MSDILTKATVLVLNRNWQAINVRTPAGAFCQMMTNAATGLDISEGAMTPVRWNEWLRLPIREGDIFANTPRGRVRVPTVVVAVRYARVPKRRPNLSARSIWVRDGGQCQYTGRRLKPGEGNIDHVVPLSRGGVTSWENCVLSHREVNSRKGSQLPQEAGLRLLRQPVAPKEVPVTVLIKNHHGIADWEHFLVA
ncbi:MAG TPA: HNH endonuclease [Chthoniobacterales bacterium]